jgi:hypothetical protein
MLAAKAASIVPPNIKKPSNKDGFLFPLLKLQTSIC